MNRLVVWAWVIGLFLLSALPLVAEGVDIVKGG